MAHGAEFEELLSRITADAERLARAGRGPSELVEAMVREGATGLAALAAERHHHAVVTRLADEHRALLSERSPVFRFDPRTLIAAPVGRLEREGFARFADRVLSAAADSRPGRVVLVLQGFEPHEDADDQIAALAEELSSFGASLERQ